MAKSGRIVLRPIIAAALLVACHGGEARAPEPTPGPQAAEPAPLPPEAASVGTPGLTAMGGASAGDLPSSPVTAPPNAGGAPAGESLRQAAPLADPQIAGISLAVNGAELEQAKLARARAKNPLVKRFAERMFSEHGEAKRQHERLLAKLQLRPAESEASSELAAEASGTLETLKKTKGAQFDAAYIEAQIALHRRVLELLDRDLIPGAQNVEVRDALVQARQRMQLHLEEAGRVQQQLPVPASSGAASGAGGQPASAQGGAASR